MKETSNYLDNRLIIYVIFKCDGSTFPHFTLFLVLHDSELNISGWSDETFNELFWEIVRDTFNTFSVFYIPNKVNNKQIDGKLK